MDVISAVSVVDCESRERALAICSTTPYEAMPYDSINADRIVHLCPVHLCHMHTLVPEPVNPIRQSSAVG